MTCTSTAFLAPAGHRVCLAPDMVLVPGAGTVSAQPAEQVFGPYTLRASSVTLDALKALAAVTE